MKYRMQDGTIVDTDRAMASWNEAKEWSGNNHISVNTGTQWNDQTLYRSRKGRYYVEHSSAIQGQRSWVEWVSDQEAARWLILNNHELPDGIKSLEDEVTE